MRIQKRELFIYASVMLCFLLAVHCGSAAVTAISEQLPFERKNCIIIDAGHGGVDGGATSCSGKPESAYNLEIALRLNDLIHFLGYDTKMIRTEDISVYTKGETIAQKKISDLKERVRIVNETEHALLLSIHQNTYSDSRYHGAQVFYPATQGSKDLSVVLQSELTAYLNPGSTRKSKPCSGVYLMEHIQTTGALIECGFISNPEEDSKLQDPDYQKKLCCIIAGTVSSFLSNT